MIPIALPPAPAHNWVRMHTLRSARRMLIAVCAVACAATAQPAPGEPVDAARALALLKSPRPVDKAWGAYWAAELHDRNLEKPLIEQLHWDESIGAAIAYGDTYASVQALLDALIQLRAEVAAQVLLPFANRWRAETLILLASPAGDVDEAALLAMPEENLRFGEWMAVNNLLLRRRSTALPGRIVREIHITHVFDVSVSGLTTVAEGGSILGSGIPDVGFPQGFPPIGFYQLEVGRTFPGRVPLITGPVQMDDVSYLRTEIPAGGTARGPRQDFDRDHQWLLRPYIADLLGLSQKETEALFCPVTRVRWQSPENFTLQAEQAMEAQAEAISGFVVAVRKKGLGDIGGMPRKIDPVIHDVRRSGDPIPPIAPKEIKFD